MTQQTQGQAERQRVRGKNPRETTWIIKQLVFIIYKFLFKYVDYVCVIIHASINCKIDLLCLRKQRLKESLRIDGSTKV